VKNEERRDYDKSEAHAVIPFELVAEKENREHREDRKRDDLLNRLKLRGVELVGADAVRGHLKTIFEKAMPQLTMITFQRASFRYFRCPYQAKVMKMLEIKSNTMVLIRFGGSSWIGEQHWH
jgi:hypothetical protein